ncbi:hypothetical protein [Rickettsia endosymbiont of Cantharis rufa]
MKETQEHKTIVHKEVHEDSAIFSAYKLYLEASCTKSLLQFLKSLFSK